MIGLNHDIMQSKPWQAQSRIKCVFFSFKHHIQCKRLSILKGERRAPDFHDGFTYETGPRLFRSKKGLSPNLKAITCFIESLFDAMSNLKTAGRRLHLCMDFCSFEPNLFAKVECCLKPCVPSHGYTVASRS